MCMHEMMAIDASGGGGLDSGMDALVARNRGDLRGRPYVASGMCVTDTAPWIVTVMAQ